MPAHEEITGTYCYEQRRFANVGEDTIIGDITTLLDGKPKRITVYGPEDDGEPTIGGTYRFYGKWQEYKNRYKGVVEQQFRFQTFVDTTPHNRLGVVNYLKQAPGLGDALAARLYDVCGASAVQFLRESPDKAASRVQGLSLAAAMEAATWLEERQAIENCMIDVMELLTGRGFRKATAKLAIKTWGNRASEIIRRDPYSLSRFPGCGFKLCDALWLHLDKPAAKLKRQALCAWHAVASSHGSGDTWHFHEVARKGLKASISGADVNPEAALRLATRAGILSAKWTAGQNGPIDDLTGTTCWLAESRKARNEMKVAKFVTEAMEGQWSDSIPANLGECSDHQVSAIETAIAGGKIAILGGSPGTGKTYTAAQLVKWIIETNGGMSVAIAAPTGKAAVRITEAMQEYGIELRAKTIHSLLQVEQGDSGEGWRFKHDRKLRLPYRFIIVDESSMIDVDLMAAFLAARHRDCSILFVGDVNQLPPVGHGAPLRDLIAAGLPYGELREICRQAKGSMIIEACAAIRDDKPWKCLDDGEQDASDPLQNLICTGGESAEVKIEILKERLLSLRGLADPVWDCQVLVAVNAKSKLARKELNPILQDLLNPNPQVAGWPFRVGDKVVCLDNGYYLADKAWLQSRQVGDAGDSMKDGKVYVANGEVGKVLAIVEKQCTVELSAPVRRVVVHKSKPGKVGGGNDTSNQNGDGQDGGGTDAASDSERESGAVGSWDLAYCLSVHKSQGSEFPFVFIMLDDYPGAMRVANREWLYTAVSRAKKCCFLVGNDAIARRMCKSVGIAKRKTFLTPLILEATQ